MFKFEEDLCYRNGLGVVESALEAEATLGYISDKRFRKVNFYFHPDLMTDAEPIFPTGVRNPPTPMVCVMLRVNVNAGAFDCLLGQSVEQVEVWLHGLVYSSSGCLCLLSVRLQL